MNLPKIKLGIFDIDGTIFRSSLAVEFIHTVVKEGIFPKSAYNEIEADYLAWLNREGSYSTYLSQLITVFLKHIPNQKETEIKNISNKILEIQKGRVYKYTRNLVSVLKKNRYHLIAVSGSPTFLVDNFTNSLHFDASFGTEFIIQNGKFTGGVIKIGDQNKLQTVKDYLASNNLQADWKNSIAVGDTTSDIPLLEAVGKPIAFNPNLELAKIAQKKKWSIVVERKDVIFYLNKYKLETKI